MKKIPRFFTFVLTIFTVLLGACSGTASPLTSAGGDKAQAMPLAFTGLVESITGNQWVINGQALTVDSAVVRDGPFNVGDRIKLEGVVNQDGSFTVSGVKTPSAQDLSTLPSFGADNSNNNSDDDNVNDANSNDNDDNDANSNDDNGNNNDNNANDDDGNNNDDDGNNNDNNANDDDGNNNDDDGNNNDNNANDDDGNNNDDDGNNNDNGG